MRPLHHRETGLAEVALLDERVTAELILDGHHLAPEATQIAMRLLDDRWIAITDAMSAAGLPDGTYKLGELDVEARAGVVRVIETQSLAGSTLTMDRAFANIVHQHNQNALRAVQATSTKPADLLKRSDIGRIERGCRADFVAWKDGALERVMLRGQWVS